VPDSRFFEFSVAEGRSADDVLSHARQQARGAGIALVGDGSSGSFDGTAAGTYSVVGRVLRVEVTRKPGLVPWGLVESTLRKLFS
jgi:hypothetical protein